MSDKARKAAEQRKVPEVLKSAAKFLVAGGVENARLEADWLLAHCLGVSRAELYLNSECSLSEDEDARFRKMLRRRVEGEPLQAILGYAEFYGRRFLMRKGVFIPRPETEGIVELAAKAMPDNGWEHVLEVGCGSGVIGLTLLLEGIARQLTAVDLSPEAVELTGRNADELHIAYETRGKPRATPLDQRNDLRDKAGATQSKRFVQVRVNNPRYETRSKPRATRPRYGTGGKPRATRPLYESRDTQQKNEAKRGALSARLTIRGGEAFVEQLTLINADAFAERFQPPGVPFDLVVSNPPYIRKDEWETLPREVRLHDPQTALLSGEDGLEAHSALARALPEWLKPGGLFIAEFGEEQGDEIRTLHETWAVKVEILRDLSGRNRYILAGPPRRRHR